MNDMNRSEELCKLLGIEPKCLNEEYSGCKYADDDSRQCCKKYKENNCEYSMYWIYPDLTKSSNFVKLLEIMVNHVADKGYTFVSSYCTMQEQLIIETFKLVENKNTIMDKYKNKLQQQAQATKWDY